MIIALILDLVVIALLVAIVLQLRRPVPDHGIFLESTAAEIRPLLPGYVDVCGFVVSHCGDAPKKMLTIEMADGRSSVVALSNREAKALAHDLLRPFAGDGDPDSAVDDSGGIADSSAAARQVDREPVRS